MAPPGDLDVKTQILQQQELQKQASAAAKTKGNSAPTSPMKDGKKASFFGKVSTFSQAVSAKVEQAKDATGNIRIPGMLKKDKCYTLLVIDDPNTDWSKYFRGRRLHGGEYDIRVEQAEFKELSVTANSEGGVTASILLYKTGNKVVRSFHPDFLLVRQNVKDASEDYRNLLLGFQYGGIPSVNSLQSIYNFQDKPWVYGHMIQVQRKLGKETFPLVNQSYYPNHFELSTSTKYPCVFKIGHAHGGLGKVKVEDEQRFQDLASLVAVSNKYCTVEPYVDAKFDLHVQKIGSNYKALMRKSISGHWKTNIGQSILEEIAVTDRYKLWIDEISQLFGGLGICSLEAVVARDGKEFIIEVNDCATTLMGESQEEDRKNITELVLKEMEDKCKPLFIEGEGEVKADTQPTPSGAKTDLPSRPAGALASAARQVSRGSLLGGGDGKPSMASTVLAMASKATSSTTAAAAPATNSPAAPPSKPPPPPTAAAKQAQSPAAPTPSVAASKPSTSGTTPSATTPSSKPEASAAVNNRRARHDSQASEASSSVSGVSSASSTVKKVEVAKKDLAGVVAATTAAKDSETTKKSVEENGDEELAGATGVEGEDTMKNLRKTFAGIFGDIKQ